MQLKGEELEQLKVLWKEYGAENREIPKDLVSFRWELKGLYPQLSESVFAQFCEPKKSLFIHKWKIGLAVASSISPNSKNSQRDTWLVRNLGLSENLGEITKKLIDDGPATHHPHRVFGTVGNTTDPSPDARTVLFSLGWLIMALTQHFRFLGIALYGFLPGELLLNFSHLFGKIRQTGWGCPDCFSYL